MSIKEIEAAVLKLVPKDRARLAGMLLESLEDLSEEENEIIWAQEAERRDPQDGAARRRAGDRHHQGSDQRGRGPDRGDRARADQAGGVRR